MALSLTLICLASLATTAVLFVMAVFDFIEDRRKREGFWRSLDNILLVLGLLCAVLVSLCALSEAAVWLPYFT